MRRLGYYTGKLYDECVDASTIHECCIILNYKEPVDENDEFIVKKRKELRRSCEGCLCCPEAQKG